MVPVEDGVKVLHEWVECGVALPLQHNLQGVASHRKRPKLAIEGSPLQGVALISEHVISQTKAGVHTESTAKKFTG